MDPNLVHDLAAELLTARQHVLVLGNPERTAGEMAAAKRTAIAILRTLLPRLKRGPATPDGSTANPVPASADPMAFAPVLDPGGRTERFLNARRGIAPHQGLTPARL